MGIGKIGLIATGFVACVVASCAHPLTAWSPDAFSPIASGDLVPRTDHPAHVLVEEVVVRFDEEDGVVVARLFARTVTRIDGAAGRRWRSAVVHYDTTFSRLEGFHARTTSPDGTVRDHGDDPDDVTDRPSLGIYTLYDDVRRREIAVAEQPAGAVVEVASLQRRLRPELFANTHLFGDTIPVGLSRFVVDAPIGWTFDVVTRGDVPAPTIVDGGGRRRQTWQRETVAALPRADHAAPAHDRLDAVAVRLRRAVLQHGRVVEGPADVAGLSKLLHGLAADRARVTPAIEAVVVDVLGHDWRALPQRVRAARLYAWTRDSIRYCAVSIGLGGWVPHPASDVEKLRYGDCKDKANLLRALLRAVDIDSELVAVWSGHWPRPFLTAALGANFNHQILRVLLDEGAVFVDPTTRTVPFGDLPPNDEERLCMPATASGSSLLETSRSSPTSDHRHIRWQLALAESGALEGSVDATLAGHFADRLRDALLEAPSSTRETVVADAIDGDAFTVTALTTVAEAPPVEAAPLSLKAHVLSPAERRSAGTGPALSARDVIGDDEPVIEPDRPALPMRLWANDTADDTVDITIPPRLAGRSSAGAVFNRRRRRELSGHLDPRRRRALVAAHDHAPSRRCVGAAGAGLCARARSDAPRDESTRLDPSTAGIRAHNDAIADASVIDTDGAAVSDTIGRGMRLFMLAFIGACALGGCAGSDTAVDGWRGELRPGLLPSDPKDAGAVILHEGVRYVARGAGGNDHTEVHVHRVIKVLTEAGFAAASAHFFVHPEGTLLAFEARTLAADGTSIPVDPATIVSDETAVGTEKIGSRSFQYPRVAVGSILELRTAMRLPWTMASVWAMVADDDWPVAHYEVELLLDRRIVPDVFVNNATPTITHDTHAANNLQRIAFSLDDIPAARREPWQPPAREVEPWWAFRVVTWKALVGHTGASTSWGQAMPKSMRRIVLEGKDLDGFKTIRGGARCAKDTTCLITAALKQLRDDVPFSGFADFFESRPLDVVERSGVANNHEKAVALYKLLRDAGVDAHIAVTTHDIAVDAATDFPAPLWFDHSLVHVASNATTLWIDPSCEACAVGELPPWLVGKRAIWLAKGESERGWPLIIASPFLAITGTPVLPNSQRRTAKMSVRVDGDVDVVEDEVCSGRLAVDVMNDEATRSDDEIRVQITRRLRQRDPSVVVVSAPRWVCDRAKASCRRELHYRVPGLATVVDDGAQLQVPPWPLSSPIEDSVQSVAVKDRRYAVQVDSDRDFIETLTIEGPPGYELVVESGKDVHDFGRVDGVLTSSVDVGVDDGRLVLTRHHALQRGRHARGQWEKMQHAFAASRAIRAQEVGFVREAPTTPTTTPTPTTTTPTTTSP